MHQSTKRGIPTISALWSNGPNTSTSRPLQCAAVIVYDVACFHPLQAWQCTDGSIVFQDNLRKNDVSHRLQLPCGQCTGCRIDRSKAWALRCMQELRAHDKSCFLTLTYDQDHLPDNGSLDHSHFQKFFKRLRQHVSPLKPRYFMCGEYGSLRGRPHFHAIVFGIDFDDKTVWRKSGSGLVLYRSPSLEQLWPFGHSSIGDVTWESAAYVARYCMKKTTGAMASFVYTDSETGEIFKPEYARMSLKPGIGASFYENYTSDIYPHDRIIYKGAKHPVPRYYDKMHEKRSPDDMEAIKFERQLDALTRTHDNTPERLQVREKVLQASLSSLKRSIK